MERLPIIAIKCVTHVIIRLGLFFTSIAPAVDEATKLVLTVSRMSGW